MRKFLAKGLLYFVALSMVVSSTGLSLVSVSIANAEEEAVPDLVIVEPYTAPTVYADLSPTQDSVEITWDPIQDDRLVGYKVVMSETNTNPEYPTNSGDVLLSYEGTSTFSYTWNGPLVCDQNYYFSVTARYNTPTGAPDNAALTDGGYHYEPGNAVLINFACEEPEPSCQGADHEFVVDLEVMGLNCGSQNVPAYDFEDIDLSTNGGSYELHTVVHRSGDNAGSPYGQDNEEFTMRVNTSSAGPAVLDQPPGTTWQIQNAGTFDFVDNTNTIHMDTTETCSDPSDMDRNSVAVTKLCLYEVEAPPTGQVKFCKQNDLNGNGILDSGEPTIHGWDFTVDGQTTYNDADDGTLDGCATLDLPYSTYNVDEVMQSGWSRTGVGGNGVAQPNGSVDLTVDGAGTYIIYFLNEAELQEECSVEDNLLVNYSFEEPVVTNASLWQKMSSVLGWVIEKASDGSATTLELHKGWSGNVAADGLQYAELDGDHSTRISQDVGTEEGAEYKLFWSFAPRHNITAEQNELSIEVDGIQVDTDGPVTGSAPLAQGDWTNSSYVFNADNTTTEIAFEDIGPSNSFGTFVDDVRLCKTADPEPENKATVIAHKIVCDNETDLPNWSGSANINADTAQDFVDSHPNCRFESDWKFEWGTNNSLLDLDGNYIGEHNVDGWYDFDALTDINGRTETELDLDNLPGRLWFREVLKDGYVPFSFPPGSAPGNDVSAEFWCNSDVVNYDNAEWIDVSSDSTYYCVAFNTEDLPEYSPYCGDGVINQEWEQCDPNISLTHKDFVGCSEQCRFIVPECSDLTLAKINVDDTQNWNGGDMTSDLFLGSASYKIPSNVWFALYYNGAHYIDPDVAASPQYEDVPGLAVQRLENNLRVVMHGTGLEGQKEHVSGEIEFYNATATTQRSDDATGIPAWNGLEKGFDGTGVGSYNAGNDEVWLADNMSHYWLTTTVADDGFYTDWTIDEDCETPWAPWCSALLGVVKHSINTPSYNPVADLNNDGKVNLTDISLVSQMYSEGNDKLCYNEFDHPEEGFQFQCEDPAVGWCDALLQGVTDSVNRPERYFEHFDLYQGDGLGVINLSDIVIMSQYMADPIGNSTTCYSHFVPPFEMCPYTDEPPVITLIGADPVYIYTDETYVDDGATAYDDEDGDITPDIVTVNPVVAAVGTYLVTYDVSDSDGNDASQVTRTVTVQTRGGGCITNCGGGKTPPDISDILAVTSCQNDATITWNTSKDSLTWMIHGLTQTYGEEILSTDYVSSHSVLLAGLEPGTTYHYLVKSKGVDNAAKVDYDRTFTTPTAESCGDTPPPPPPPGPTPPEVLGEKILSCDFMRPSHSTGPDVDIDQIFQYPDGSLLRDACSAEMMVYLLREQKKWHIPSWQYLHDNYLGQRIYNVLTDVLDNYPDWEDNKQILGIKEFADGSLLRGSDMRIYIIEDGHKRHIKTLKELAKYAGEEIYNVTDDVLNKY